MGKARIVGGGEDGYYTVQILHQRDRLEAEMDGLQKEIDRLNKQRQELLDKLTTVETDLRFERQQIMESIRELESLLESMA